MRKLLFPRIHGLDHDLCIKSVICSSNNIKNVSLVTGFLKDIISFDSLIIQTVVCSREY